MSADFSLAHPALAGALAARGYALPTAVQQAVLEAGDNGRDLLVSAQTGSGKTVAFGLAMAHELLDEHGRLPDAGTPLALAIAPTRELALQVREELNWLYAPTGARIVTCVGGMDPRAEREALRRGAHIVVGTPGRLRDHLERGQLDAAGLRVVVLDEADEMLDLGFREDLEFILKTTPDTRRTLLFSATIAKEIAALARSFQRDARRIDTVRRDEPHGDIEYRALTVAQGEAELAVVNVLRFYESPGALVFCATRDGVRHLHARLQERGFAAVALSGELSQAERSRALAALRDGRARVCIATDVASRGLDLPSLDLVLHADLPNSKESLLHRSGRTGRAGRKGVSVLLVPRPHRRKAEFLLQRAGVAAGWGEVPRAEDIRARDQLRLLDDPRLEAPGEAALATARRLLECKPAEELVAGLLRMVEANQPAPEDLAEAGGRDAVGRDGGTRSRPTGVMAPFTLAIGRRNNADPKWLLPLICRLGGVTKQQVGRIRIQEAVTEFEVVADAAASFMASVRQAGPHEAQITPGGTEESPPPRRFMGKPGGKPAGDRPGKGFSSRKRKTA